MLGANRRSHLSQANRFEYGFAIWRIPSFGQPTFGVAIYDPRGDN